VKYKTAQAWKASAMQRAQGVSDAELERRSEIARNHIDQHDEGSSAEMWEDYMLYITGRMEIEEYQAYLLFKHSRTNG